MNDQPLTPSREEPDTEEQEQSIPEFIAVGCSACGKRKLFVLGIRAPNEILLYCDACGQLDSLFFNQQQLPQQKTAGAYVG